MPKRNHKVYKDSDIVLPMLTLPDPCNILIDIDEDLNTVSLLIGQRDWTWDKRTGELIGCGTLITGMSSLTKPKKSKKNKLKAARSKRS
jgi:hypothetical protein